jgi:hypothetical protein
LFAFSIKSDNLGLIVLEPRKKMILEPQVAIFGCELFWTSNFKQDSGELAVLRKADWTQVFGGFGTATPRSF